MKIKKVTLHLPIQCLLIYKSFFQNFTEDWALIWKEISLRACTPLEQSCGWDISTSDWVPYDIRMVDFHSVNLPVYNVWKSDSVAFRICLQIVSFYKFEKSERLAPWPWCKDIIMLPTSLFLVFNFTLMTMPVLFLHDKLSFLFLHDKLSLVKYEKQYWNGFSSNWQTYPSIDDHTIEDVIVCLLLWMPQMGHGCNTAMTCLG